MKTVYQHCIENAELNETIARKVATSEMRQDCLKDAAKWRERAGRLSIEDGQRDMDDPSTILSEILGE
jgi:hypothetical protein